MHSGSAGSFLKSYDDTGKKKKYYKLSDFDPVKGIIGHECVNEMFVIDYLVLNRDRHGANIEILRDLKTKTVRPAPLFDHGLSLVCRCHTSEELNFFRHPTQRGEDRSHRL